MFDDFPTLYSYVQSGEQEKINIATEQILQMQAQPGFLEYLLRLLIQTGDQGPQLFISTQIMNNVKTFWENDQLYSNKPEIRNALIKILINAPPLIIETISNTISLIAQRDFPSRWGDLLLELANGLENASLQSIYAITLTAQNVLEKYKPSTHLHFEERNPTLEVWDVRSFALISEILPQAPASPGVYKCVENVINIIKSLFSQSIPKFYEDCLPALLSVLTNYMMMNSEELIPVKIKICNLVKMLIVQYQREFADWGKTEENRKEPELIEQLVVNWHSLLMSVFTVIQCGDDQLIVSAFDALNALARSQSRGIFLENNLLQNLCSQILIPCIQLNDEDLYNFDNNPYDYFSRDIEGIDASGSKRSSANLFLRTLCRYFRNELSAAFMANCQNLLQSYQSDPKTYWINLDTAIFIMAALAIKVNLYGIGVKEIAEGFDIVGFVNQFILPQLDPSNQLYILQTDALKFIVDFRLIIKEIIPEIFPIIVQLLQSPSAAVIFYSSYCVEQILKMKDIDKPLLLSKIDIPLIIQTLFKIFRFNDELNIQAVRCLLRIVCGGQQFIQPHIPSITNTLIDYIMKMCQHPIYPEFTHQIFEIFAASITKANVNVQVIEQQILQMCTFILQNNVIDYTPYAFQLIGVYLLGNPDEVNQFYVEQYTNFIAPQIWQPQGNIPALTYLMRAYCIKLPQLICQSMPQILLICQQLLQMSLSNVNAFSIFTYIFRYLQPEITLPYLQQVIALIVPQIGNEQLIKYRQSFAVLMANFANFLGPINLIQNINDEIIDIWTKCIPFTQYRKNTEIVIAGVLKTLLEASNLTAEAWTALFVALIDLHEMPYNENSRKEEISEMHEEEKSAMEFDVTFSKLECAELPMFDNYPELHTVDLGAFIVTQLAAFSQQHPGVLMQAVAHLKPIYQQHFVKYQEKYQVQFY
ncbi:exportin-2 [Histomonas meleagridis]|uniref:exportin-2 n=1 Tax=Histomonas meleagridis TaxID=135588 RepID=UPI0035594DEC|nr:exportin-2 [Histomonas meleagridis]KAH0798309.1 exportin-2 [Histomonas meleagridis]